MTGDIRGMLSQNGDAETDPTHFELGSHRGCWMSVIHVFFAVCGRPS